MAALFSSAKGLFAGRSTRQYNQLALDDDAPGTTVFDIGDDEEKEGNNDREGLLGRTSVDEPRERERRGLRSVRFGRVCGLHCNKFGFVVIFAAIVFGAWFMFRLFFSTTESATDDKEVQPISDIDEAKAQPVTDVINEPIDDDVPPAVHEGLPGTDVDMHALPGQPKFNESLGCLNAPFVYGKEKTVFAIPVVPGKNDHYLNVRGGAVGTILLTSGSDNKDVVVEMTVRSDKEDLLDSVIIDQHDPEITEDSYWRLSTPYPKAIYGSDDACMRYDVVVHIPPTVKKLHVASHAVAHIKFDDTITAVDASAAVKLEDFYVTFFSPREENMLVANTQIQAERMSLELPGGWMVGQAAMLQSTRLLTQRGTAHANVDVITMPSVETPSSVASLQTVTGVGESHFSIINSPHRVLDAHHQSSGNGDIFLHYEEASFNGTVRMATKTHETQGLDKMGASVTLNEVDPDARPMWSGGSKNRTRGGVDEMDIRSRLGFVGLYF